MNQPLRIKVVGPSITIPTLISILLATLKLCGVIGWSWWIVVLPACLPWLVFGLFILWATIMVWRVYGKTTQKGNTQ